MWWVLHRQARECTLYRWYSNTIYNLLKPKYSFTKRTISPLFFYIKNIIYNNFTESCLTWNPGICWIHRPYSIFICIMSSRVSLILLILSSYFCYEMVMFIYESWLTSGSLQLSKPSKERSWWGTDWCERRMFLFEVLSMLRVTHNVGW